MADERPPINIEAVDRIDAQLQAIESHVQSMGTQIAAAIAPVIAETGAASTRFTELNQVLELVEGFSAVAAVGQPSWARSRRWVERARSD
jgi:hypothetical protein